MADLSFPLRCACGLLEGHVAATHRAGRAICYGHDCQAFARFLGAPETALDARGGADNMATAPRFMQFTVGTEKLRCMSLGPRGLLRWYSGFCRTPIGNIPRSPKLSCVGLVHRCLAGTPAAKDIAFGPARLVLNPQSASGQVALMLLAMLKILRNVGGSRLSGSFRQNPFFKAGTDEPIVPPQMLVAAQRRALRGTP